MYRHPLSVKSRWNIYVPVIHVNNIPHWAEFEWVLPMDRWRINLGERSEGSPHRINVSVRLSIRLSIRPSGIPKHVDFSCRNLNWGVHVEFSVRHPSPTNTYSYVRGENSGSTRKSVVIYLLFTCITNLILLFLCRMSHMEWLKAEYFTLN